MAAARHEIVLEHVAKTKKWQGSTAGGPGSGGLAGRNGPGSGAGQAASTSWADVSMFGDSIGKYVDKVRKWIPRNSTETKVTRLVSAICENDDAKIEAVGSGPMHYLDPQAGQQAGPLMNPGLKQQGHLAAPLHS